MSLGRTEGFLIGAVTAVAAVAVVQFGVAPFTLRVTREAQIQHEVERNMDFVKSNNRGTPFTREDEARLRAAFEKLARDGKK